MFSIFKEKEYKKKFISLMIPLALQEAIVVLSSTIGVFMLATVDDEIMSGVGVANNLFFLFNSVLCAIILVGCALSAQYYGKRDLKSVNQVFNFSIKLALIVSLLFFMLCEAIPYQLIYIFLPDNSEAEIIANYGCRYLRIFAISFLFRGISAMYIYILKNINETKKITFITLISLFLNIAICAIMLYTPWLTLENKIYAPGVSIVVARFIELILSIYFVNKKKEIKFNFHDFLHIDKEIFQKFNKLIVFIFISKVGWSVGSMGVSLLMGRIDNINVIHAYNLWNVSKNIIISVSGGAAGAAAVLLGQELGANKLKEAKEHGNQIFKFALLVGIFNIVVYIGLCGLGYLASIQVLEKEAKHYFVMMSLLFMPSLLFQAYNSILMDGAYNSGGDSVFIALANSLPFFIIVIPLGIIAIKCNFPILLTIFLINSEEIAKSLPILFRYHKYKWVRDIADERK